MLTGLWWNIDLFLQLQNLNSKIAESFQIYCGNFEIYVSFNDTFNIEKGELAS